MEYSSKQYSHAREILNKNVPGQYVFSDYFLHISEEDSIFTQLLNESEVAEIPTHMIDSRVKNYMSKVKVLEQKSNNVAEWKDYPKFEFFQFVVTNKDLFLPLENVSIDELQTLSNQIKDGTISEEQAFEHINLDIQKVKSFVSTMVDDFKIGDD